MICSGHYTLTSLEKYMKNGKNDDVKAIKSFALFCDPLLFFVANQSERMDCDTVTCLHTHTHAHSHTGL